MSLGHDKLKSIGAQKIHEATHISRLHVQAIIHESYDDMTRIQFLGFISILEREYNLDLSDLRDRGIKHFDELIKPTEESKKVFVGVEKKKNYTIVYAFIAVVIFIGVSYLSLEFSNSQEEDAAKIDNTNIENVKANINTSNSEENASVVLESNTTEELNTTTPDLAKKEQVSITPSSDLWIGYMDLDTRQKYQTTISKDEVFDLDANRDWLLTFGHGYFSIVIDGETTEYTDKKTIRFTYKDSNLTKISYREFLNLQKGD